MSLEHYALHWNHPLENDRTLQTAPKNAFAGRIDFNKFIAFFNVMSSSSEVMNNLSGRALIAQLVYRRVTDVLSYSNEDETFIEHNLRAYRIFSCTRYIRPVTMQSISAFPVTSQNCPVRSKFGWTILARIIAKTWPKLDKSFYRTSLANDCSSTATRLNFD